jgi:hypothetical protein
VVDALLLGLHCFRYTAGGLHIFIPYWALNFIVLLLAGFSKPVRGPFADPRAAGARLSTAGYQFNWT